MRALIAITLTLWISDVFAANLYKCQTKDGTTIYQNDPCPHDTVTVGKGSYQRRRDDPSTNYSAMANSDREHAQLEQQEFEAQQARTLSGGDVDGGSVSESGRGYQCSGNGKVWMQSTPCPASTTAFKSVIGIHGLDQYGNSVTGSGTLIEQAPVEQRGMSKSEICNRLSQPPAGCA